MAFFVWTMLLVPAGGILAQPLAGSQQNPGAEWPVTLRYRQELNNYLWQLDAGRSFTLTPRLQWQFSEQYRTSMLRLSSSEDKWKDEHAFFTRFGYQLWPALQLNALLRSLSFYDRQTGLFNDVRSHAAGIGLRFTPSPRVRLTAAAGILELSTDRFAQSVAIEIAGFLPADNWFHLAPGGTRSIRLAPCAGTDPTTRPSGTIRGLGVEADISF